MSLHFKNLKKSVAAKIALDNHLYVNGWNLQNDYEKIINGDRYKEYIDIQVMFIGDKPIGCALIAVNRQISIYMSDKYRGRGRNYASLLINFILRKNCLKKYEVFAYYGSERSPRFFEKNKILLFYNGCIPFNKKYADAFLNKEMSLKMAVKKQLKELYLEKIMNILPPSENELMSKTSFY